MTNTKSRSRPKPGKYKEIHKITDPITNKRTRPKQCQIKCKSRQASVGGDNIYQEKKNKTKFRAKTDPNHDCVSKKSRPIPVPGLTLTP